jgi:hypothetical protein
MQNHNFLAFQGAKERPPYTLFPLRANFKQAFPEGFRVRRAKQWPIFGYHFSNMEKIRQNSRRESKGFGFNLLAEKCYVPFHEVMLSFLITKSTVLTCKRKQGNPVSKKIFGNNLETKSAHG